jgi:phosphate transport system substrate-binding protein
LKFFDWAYSNGAKMAEELDYVPMPESVVASVRKVWTGQIKDAAGKPLYTIAH